MYFLVQTRKMVVGSTNQLLVVFGGDYQNQQAWPKKIFSAPSSSHQYSVLLKTYLPLHLHHQIPIHGKWGRLETNCKNDVDDLCYIKFCLLMNFFQFDCYGQILQPKMQVVKDNLSPFYRFFKFGKGYKKHVLVDIHATTPLLLDSLIKARS